MTILLNFDLLFVEEWQFEFPNEYIGVTLAVPTFDGYSSIVRPGDVVVDTHAIT